MYKRYDCVNGSMFLCVNAPQIAKVSWVMTIQATHFPPLNFLCSSLYTYKLHYNDFILRCLLAYYTFEYMYMYIRIAVHSAYCLLGLSLKNILTYLLTYLYFLTICVEIVPLDNCAHSAGRQVSHVYFSTSPVIPHFSLKNETNVVPCAVGIS